MTTACRLGRGGTLAMPRGVPLVLPFADNIAIDSASGVLVRIQDPYPGPLQRPHT